MFNLLLYIVVIPLLLLIAYWSGRARGFWRGQIKAHADRNAYVDKRIKAAQAGVTQLSIVNYEEHACSTIASKSYGTPLWFAHICFKLGGEAGEFQEHIGKAIRDDDWDIYKDGVKALTPDRRMALIKELGDIIWYVVVIARELGSCLAEVMLINIQKRDGRKQRGTLKGSGDNR